MNTISNDSIWPEHGAAYRCLRSSKAHSTTKGKVYIYEHHASGIGPELVNYNSRWQNRLLNAYDALRQPGAFENVDKCPFCGTAMYEPSTEKPSGFNLIHDAAECAHRKPEAA